MESCTHWADKRALHDHVLFNDYIFCTEQITLSALENHTQWEKAFWTCNNSHYLLHLLEIQ